MHVILYRAQGKIPNPLKKSATGRTLTIRPLSRVDGIELCQTVNDKIRKINLTKDELKVLLYEYPNFLAITKVSGVDEVDK